MEEDIEIIQEMLRLNKNRIEPQIINAIENLINKNKELEKENKENLEKYFNEINEDTRIIKNNKEKIEELEKMVEIMNEYILKNCVSLDICSKQIGKECYVDVIYGDECKECVIDYFRKKAKGE